MFKRLSFLPLLSFSLMSSCQPSRPYDEVVCQTYVHRYGVPLDPQDWSSRGKHGQIVSLLKDGVTATRSYDSGVLEGECFYTFPHRELIFKKELYSKGILLEETTHYISGMPKQHLIYHSPYLSITTWYENGAPQSQEEWHQNKIQKGEYFTFSNQIEATVEEGKGLRICRNDQGEVEYVDTIEEGQTVQRTTYHLNGVPATATPYKLGKIEGERRTYSSEGEPVTIETWKNNFQQGVTDEYEYGEKVAEISYLQGKKHGIEKRFGSEGKGVVNEITWVKGKKQGPCHYYVGNTRQTDWYFADRCVDKAVYDRFMKR